MKNTLKQLKVVGYVVLAGALVTLMAVAANASAVWGN
jgi:hypothetical protein